MQKGQGLMLDGQALAHIEVCFCFSGFIRHWQYWTQQVLLNNEGTEEGSLLKLLSRCITPFGLCLRNSQLRRPLTRCSYAIHQGKGYSGFGYACHCEKSRTSTLGISRFFLRCGFFIPNRDPLYRLDAVEDLLHHDTFEKDFIEVAKGLPDLERIVSRIHGKNCKVRDFLRVLAVRFGPLLTHVPEY